MRWMLEKSEEERRGRKRDEGERGEERVREGFHPSPLLPFHKLPLFSMPTAALLNKGQSKRPIRVQNQQPILVLF